MSVGAYDYILESNPKFILIIRLLDVTRKSESIPRRFLCAENEIECVEWTDKLVQGCDRVYPLRTSKSFMQ